MVVPYLKHEINDAHSYILYANDFVIWFILYNSLVVSDGIRNHVQST